MKRQIYRCFFQQVLLAIVFLLISSFISPNALAQTTSLTTSGVLYNSDSSANIARVRTTKIQLTQNLLAPTQGWVVVRMKTGFASTTTLSPDPVIWDMSQSDPNDLFVYYDVGSDTFHLVRNSKVAGGKTLASPKQTFAVGAFKTVIAAWTATSLKISVDGAPFVSTATTTVPAQAPFLIGSSLVQGTKRQPDSDYYWVSAGTGTLTDTDAASINSFGNTDKRRVDFPGNAVFVWWANNDQYNNDSGGVTSTNTPTPTRPPVSTNTSTPRPTSTITSRPTTTPVAIPGDANSDGKVDGIDFTIWLNHYGQNVSSVQNGDFNNDGKVDGIDFTIWLTNYGRVF